MPADTFVYMRRTFIVAALAAAFTVPAASADTPGDGTLSVKRGRGLVTIKLRRGTVIGRLGNGRVQIKDFRPFDNYAPQFLNCRRPRYVNLTTTACQGKNISFKAVDGRYNVTVRGSGIFLSVAGRGTFVVDGAGDDGLPDGVMEMNDGPYESLPDFATSYTLEAPPPGG
jgi:hypothetical protein